jgi:hypothetical protein
MSKKRVLTLFTSGMLICLSLGVAKQALAQNNRSNQIPNKPFYERNIGNGRRLEADSTGGGVRFKNGIRVGVERIPVGKPKIERRGNTTIIDNNPTNTGVGINYRF